MAILIPRKKGFWQQAKDPFQPETLNSGHWSTDGLTGAFGYGLIEGVSDNGSLDLKAQTTLSEDGLSISTSTDELSEGGAITGSNVSSHPLSEAGDFTFLADITPLVGYSPPDYRSIFARRSGQTTYQYHFRLKNSGVLSLLTTGGGVDSSFTVGAGERAVVAVSSSASGRTFLKNDSVESAAFKSISYVNTDSVVGSAGYDTTDYLAFGGTIHSLAVYNRALDEDELLSLAANPRQILKPRRKYWVLPTAAGGTTVTPPTGAITYTGFAPTVTATDNQIVDVPVGAVTLTGYAPTVTIGDAVEVEIPAGAITYTGLAPTVTASDNQSIEVATGSVSYTGFAPTVTVGNPVEITVPTGAVSYAGDVPTVTTTENQVIEVSTGAVTYTGLAPSVLISDPQLVDIPVGAIAYTGYAPTVTIGAIQTPDCFEVLSSHIDEDGVTASSAIVAELALNGIINSNGQSLSSKITSSISLSSPICSH